MATTEDGSVSALLVAESAGDRYLVQDVFQRRGWRLYETADRSKGLQYLEKKLVQVVIAESEIFNWNWKRVLSDLRRLTPTPQLVVASRTADDYLWAEVLNVGGYDVLAQPLDREELERVVASARRHFGVQPRKPAYSAMAPAARAAS